MTNPARELHSLFTEWKENGGHSSTARGYTGDDSDTAQALAEAAALVEGVRRCIDDLRLRGRNMDTPAKHLVGWTFAVFNYPRAWLNETITPLLGAHGLDVLDMLAHTIDNEMGVSNAVEQVRHLLDEADELLRDDDTITDQMRAYLYKLLQEIRRTMDDARVLNTFDLQESLTRLWVAFYGAAAQSTREQGRWKGLADRLWFPAVSGLLGSLPGVAISAIALTTGAS